MSDVQRMADVSGLLRLEGMLKRHEELRAALKPVSEETNLSLDELMSVTVSIAEYFSDVEIVKMSYLAYEVHQRMSYSFSYSFNLLFRAMFWERIGQDSEEVINKAYAALSSNRFV